jgi:hypothetical protein
MSRHVSWAETEDGRGVYGWGIAGGHTERTQTDEKVRGVAGGRDGEGWGGAVVGDREAKKFGGDGVGFSVVESRKTRDKIVEVRAERVFDAEIVHD